MSEVPMYGHLSLRFSSAVVWDSRSSVVVRDSLSSVVVWDSRLWCGIHKQWYLAGVSLGRSFTALSIEPNTLQGYLAHKKPQPPP